jgi:DNA polymerase-1
MQQISSRDPELAPMIRSIFVPEGGDNWWSLDWSQIEFRCFSHYASGPGSDDVREKYQDPETDFHDMAHDIIFNVSGKDLGRKPTKNCNFLSLFGGGAKKLAMTAGVSFDEAGRIFESYHEGLPCVRHTFRKAQHVAERRGWIRTYGGRKCRYPLWEPSGFTTEKPLPYEGALEVYGPSIKRANSRKALNNLIQGSAADLMKIAMVRIYEELGLACNLVVHDEVCFSTANTDLVKDVKYIMEDFNMRVPITVDVESGPDWGHVKETEG